jgi:hypothetical protein
LLVLLAAVLISGVVVALDRPNTQEWQVIIGGLAGAVAASIALLLRSGGLGEMEDRLARHGVIAIFIPIITGLAAGAFSVLTALALFHNADSLASAAVFGGLYGLLLGGWSNSVLGHVKAEEEPTIIEAALAQLGREVGALQSRRYNGDVRARFEPATEDRELVLGSLKLLFVPVDRSFASDADWVPGPVRIDDGEVADSVPFEVSIIADARLVVYPRSREVVVPAREVSDVYDFTIARAQLHTEEPRALRDQEEPRPHPRMPVVLVDIAQGGRTVQLLELPLKSSVAAHSK